MFDVGQQQDMLVVAVLCDDEDVTVLIDHDIKHTRLGIIVTVNVTDRDCKHFKPPHS